jgi:drug/metabolite transporter (DMT)-like permease
MATAESAPPAAALGWAFGAGVSGIIGLGAFYLALARGTMGLIAPLAAVIGAGLPVLAAFVAGERVGDLRLLGILVALVAVVPISLPGGERAEEERRQARIDLRDVPLVLISGLGFAGFYLLMDASREAGANLWWPLAAVRSAGLLAVLTAIVVLAWRRKAPLAGRVSNVLGLGPSARRGLAALAPLLLVAGLGDLGGNAFFVLANLAGELAVAVVLSSLYPVVTTVLAAIVLRERLRAWQIGGIALAAVGVVLITGGDEIQALFG